VCPQDATQQADGYSGKTKDHTVKNVLLVGAPLTILFLSDTYGGRTHDKRIADATPHWLPPGSQPLQALGFLGFTLPEVESLMPRRKPRGQALTLEQRWSNEALHQHQLRIEHVNSSVKRCRVAASSNTFFPRGEGQWSWGCPKRSFWPYASGPSRMLGRDPFPNTTVCPLTAFLVSSKMAIYHRKGSLSVVFKNGGIEAMARPKKTTGNLEYRRAKDTVVGASASSPDWTPRLMYDHSYAQHWSSGF